MTNAITKLREPAALGAVAYAALSTLAAVISLLFAGGGSFTDIAYGDTGSLLSFPVALAVAIAVFLANHAGPAVARARLITLVSLAVVAVAAIVGLVSFFAGFGANASGTGKFAYFLSGAGGAIAIALAGRFTWLTWQTHAPAQPAASVGPLSPGGWAPGPQQQQAQRPQQPPHPGPAAAPAPPPPGAFNWKPGNAAEQTAYLPPQNPAGAPPTLQAQQSASGSFSVPPPQPQYGQPQQPQQPQPQYGQQQRPYSGGGAEATQMMPPVPPPMQEYAPSSQPWQPHGPGGNVPPQQQGRPVHPGERPDDPEQDNGPFGVGNWQ